MKQKKLHVLVLASLLAPAAHATVIDNFYPSTPLMYLSYPPGGTSAETTVTAAQIFGGARDEQLNLTGVVPPPNNNPNPTGTLTAGGANVDSQFAVGNVVFQWDGGSGVSHPDPSGLGLDLTDGRTADVVLLQVDYSEGPVNATVNLYSESAHASSTTFALPVDYDNRVDNIFRAIPFNAFTPIAGNGVNPEQIGAVTLTLSLNPDPRFGDAVTELQSISTVPGLIASQSVSVVLDNNGDGIADPGDLLEYTLTLSTNLLPGAQVTENNVVARVALDPNTALIAQSVGTTQGSVTQGNTQGDTSVAVNVGTIATNDVTITFLAAVNQMSVDVKQISAQATASTATLQEVLADPTVISARGDIIFANGFN